MSAVSAPLPARLLAVALAVAASAPAFARGADDSAASPSEAAAGGTSTAPAAAPASPPAEIVVTGTRSPEARDASTVHTGVVTRAEAERRGATTVAEALEGEPGVQVNPNSYGFVGAPSGIVMQGLDAERVLILRDGERFIGDQDGVTDLSQISVGDVQRIEYVFGPSSSLYGTGALGGVVNVVTGPPRTQGFSSRSRLELRSLPEFVGQADSAYRRGDTFGGVFAGYQHRAGVSQFSDRPDLTLAERGQVDASGRFGLTRGGKSAYAEARWTRRMSKGLQSQLVPGLGRYLIDIPEDVERFQLRSRQEASFGQGAYVRLALSGQFFGGVVSRDRQNSPLDEVRTKDQSLLSAELLGNYVEGPRTWLAGMRVEREAFAQSVNNTVLVSGVPMDAYLGEVAPVRLANGALYTQLAWDVGDVLKLLPGVRGELHNRFGAVVAPRLALAYQPSDALRVRASGGSGFRAPGAKEYGFTFDHSFLGYRVIGNPDLAPERSWGVSGDVIWLWDAKTRFRVAGFHNWVSSLINIEYLRQSSPGVDDYGYVNVGSARTAGMDGSVSWHLAPRLRSELSYSFLWTRNDDERRPLPSRPQHTFLSALTYEPISSWELTLRARTVSNSYVANGITSPAFLKADVSLTKRLAPYLELYARVLNLLDEKEAPTALGDQRPVIGRLFAIGLTAHYEESEDEP